MNKDVLPVSRHRFCDVFLLFGRLPRLALSTSFSDLPFLYDIQKKGILQITLSNGCFWIELYSDISVI